MPHYFINNHAQPNGDHDVHAVGCRQMPSDKRYLGNFESLPEAMMEARKEFWQSNHCMSCGHTKSTPAVAAGTSESGLYTLLLRWANSQPEG
jgi:hypothetical protein